MVLKFEIEIVRPKDLLEPVQGAAGLGKVIGEDGLGDFTGQAGGDLEIFNWS